MGHKFLLPALGWNLDLTQRDYDYLTTNIDAAMENCWNLDLTQRDYDIVITGCNCNQLIQLES